MTFAARRAREHVGLLTLLALIAALVVAGSGGVVAAAERMVASGAARILADAEPGARTVRVVAARPADAAAQGIAAQDAAVRETIAAAFSEVEVVVSRRASARIPVSPIATTPAGTPEGVPAGAPVIGLLDDARLPELVTITAGGFPGAPGEIALPEAAAERQGLSVGDSIAAAESPAAAPGSAAPGSAAPGTSERDGTAFTVVGVWTADDPADPAWHGDPAAASGVSDGAFGPAIVAPGALDDLPGAVSFTWEVAPSGADVAELPALRRGVAALDELPDEVDPQRTGNTRILGGLGETLQREAAAVSAARGLLVAPQLIVALLGALVLGIALAALVAARGGELALLRARGASAKRLALAAAAEAACVTALGSLVALAGLWIAGSRVSGSWAAGTGTTATGAPGTGAAGIGSAEAGAAWGSVSTLAPAITVEVGTVEVGTVAFGTAAFAAVVAGAFVLRRTAGAAGGDAARSDAAAVPRMALLLPAGIAVALAAFSTWQLFAAGSATRSDGAADPLAAAAPALLLIAVCALAPTAAAPLAALAERLLRRTRWIAPSLPLRQIARRMGGSAVAILCLALAAASLAFAVAAPAIQHSAEQRARVSLLGGDVRVISDDAIGNALDPALDITGEPGAAEIVRLPVTVGSDSVELVAGAPETLGLPQPGSDAQPGTAAGLPVTVSRSLADRIGAAEGTVFSARIRSVPRPVPLEVSRIVDAIPGVGGGWGIAADVGALAGVGADLPPNELWVRSDSPEETADRLRRHAIQPVSILTAAQVSSAPVASVVPAVLMGGALVAAALGCIGFAAAAAAAGRARRGEGFVLRSLGLRPSQQRALRIGETAGLAAYAVLVGALLGAVVALVALPVVLGAGS